MGAAPSSPAGGHAAADRLLILEVLGGWVCDREWRLGDWWTIGVLGLIRPYVVVTFRGQQHQTGIVEMPLGCHEECTANFNVRMALPMATSLSSLDPASGPGDDNTVHLLVRDKRYVQAVMRGDPLIGEATLTLDRSADGRQVSGRVVINLPGGKPAGWLNVQYRVLEAQSFRRILSVPSEHSLLAVAKAVADVLRTPDGVEQLLASRPMLYCWASKAGPADPSKPVAEVDAWKASGSSCVGKGPFQLLDSAGQLLDTAVAGIFDTAGRVRARVDEVAEALQVAVDSTSRSGNASDEELLDRLASVARKVLVFVADFAGQDVPGAHFDVVAFAVQWVKNFFTNVVSNAAGGERMKPNLARLDRFFALAPLYPEDLLPVDKRGQEVTVPSKWNPGMKAPEKAVLGKGSYGSVWRAKDRSIKQLFAVKQMPFSGSGVDSKISERELKVAEHLKTVSHPCIVRLVSVHQHERFNCCSLVMEFCADGDLQGQICAGRSAGSYTVPKLALAWVAQIFLGLEYLHLVVGMLVRDVKPPNVVLAHGLRAKLTDFGMSRLAATSDGTFSFHPCVPPGSPHYVAPEVLQGCGYDYRADLYSLAVLVWVLFTGGLKNSPQEPIPPCANMTGRDGLTKLTKNWQLLEAAILEPGSQGAWPLPSKDAKDFVLKLTDRRPEHPWCSHEDVRNHAFLQEVELPAGDGAAVAEWLQRFDGYATIAKP